VLATEDMAQLDVVLARGATRFVELHAAELPQKDEFCGAFCLLIAFGAAGLGDAAADQDAVAAGAGTCVTRGGDAGSLPAGEPGRRDYRLALREIDDASRAGTTVAGMIRAVERLTGGELAAVPLRGDWDTPAVRALIGLAARAHEPLALIANIATDRLWGARCPPATWLRYLQSGALDGPPADWDVGHFVCLLGAVHGPAGTLVIVADTYPTLGWRGIHLQPIERIVAALERPGRTAGGVLAVARPGDVSTLRDFAAMVGLVEEPWDNGTAP
jgi:hypothetical protein